MGIMSVFDNNVNLLFGKSGQKEIGGVVIDAFVSEKHSMYASVSQYPVEEGYNISDHVTQGPDGLSISAVVGPQPVKILGGVLTLTSLKNQAYQVYEALLVLKELGEPIEVVTGLKVYNNMIIDGMNITRTKDNGQSLEFDMTFSQITIVKSQTTTIPASQKKIAGGKKYKGSSLPGNYGVEGKGSF